MEVLYHQAVWYSSHQMDMQVMERVGHDRNEWKSRVMCGDADSMVPRMVEVPVRLPLSAPRYAGSVDETQRELKTIYFAPSQLAKAMT
jgi:hypothetical protein